MDNPIKQEVEDTSIKPEANNEQQICRFCYTYEENMPEVQEKEREMMRTLCLTLDLSLTENPLICSTCRKKLEDYYNFKKTCIYTEECIAPYVVENVKVNLSEIFGCVVKCEDGMDINMCRLCMQPTDNDNTLTGEDREQFEQFFPEVNLNVTCIVVVCTKCYGLLQKLLVFMSLCLEREEKLHSYSEGEKVALENFLHFLKYQTSSKDELIDTKNEMCIEKEEMHGKSEEELDEKFSLTNTELEIKDEAEMDDTSSNERLADLSNQILDGKSKPKIYQCKLCESRFSEKLNISRHLKMIHGRDIKTYKCDHCSFMTKYKQNLRIHTELLHKDPSEITMYKCEKCDFQTKRKHSIMKHVEVIHCDPANVIMIKCPHCPIEFREKRHLRRHIKLIHDDPSKIKKYKCDHCQFETKYKQCFTNHVSFIHGDPSKFVTYKCTQCDYESKYNFDVKKHTQIVHSTDTYLCKHCNFKTKYQLGLTKHVNLMHSDRDKLQMYKCDKCTFETKSKSNLSKHLKYLHTDSSEIQMFKCRQCRFETKYTRSLRNHVRKIHSDPSKQTFKCQKCHFECARIGYKRHRCSKKSLVYANNGVEEEESLSKM